MVKLKPYFMENEEWYYYDWNKMIYKLTNKASAKAIKSYYEFYNEEDDN